VIACSLPLLIEMQVSYDDVLKWMINDDYYDGDYFTLMVVYLNVLDLGSKTVFMYNSYG
jgi:hypothetical protein